MINRIAQDSQKRRRVSIWIVVIFVLYSAFVIRFRFFNTPPGATICMPITEAKKYYFEESSITAKKLQFTLFVYKDLWLSLPSVSEVITSDEIRGEGLDIPSIVYVTIDGQKMSTSFEDKASSQKHLFEETLKQVSAAEWGRIIERLIRSVAIWLCAATALVTWFIHLKNSQHCHPKIKP